MAESAVLVLNNLYQAVQITSTRRAFRLFYAGRVRAVDADFRTYDFDNWCDLPPGADHETIMTPRRKIRIPRVIQLLHYDRVPRREVRFTRRNIFFRDRNRCQYCGKVFMQAELNLDHVVPLSRGGTSSWENVVCACLPCNVRKGNRTPDESGMKLKKAPVKPKATPLGLLSPHRIHPTWKNFLDMAYWNVELK